MQTSIIKTSDIVPGNFGHYVGDTPMTSSEAIKEAGLDWDVALKSISLFDEPGVKIPTHKAVTRLTDNHVLGLVGNVYEPVQNSTAFEFMDSLVSDGSMRYHTVGNIKGGKKVWILGQTGSFDVVPGDQVDKFLFLWNTHDGSSALRCLFTTIRIVCQNAVRSILGAQNSDSVRLQHTRSIDTGLIEAKNILGFSEISFNKFETIAELLVKKQVNTVTLDKFVKSLFPDPPPEAKRSSADRKRTEIIRLFEEGLGNNLPKVQGTAWAAFNAVTEYANHYKSVHGKNKAESRFAYNMFGGGSELANTAGKLLLAA